MTRHPTDRASLERDCDASYLRAGGPGGQHANRNETGVRLVHRPTGLTVTATERRSRKRNLDAAYDRMAARLEAAQRPVTPRRPTRPGAGARERRLEDKRKTSLKKADRRWTRD